AVAVEAFLGEVEQLAGVEQGLAGDAADVEAGAAEGRALLDAGDGQAELSRAGGPDVAPRAPPDHDEGKPLSPEHPPEKTGHRSTQMNTDQRQRLNGLSCLVLIRVHLC